MQIHIINHGWLKIINHVRNCEKCKPMSVAIDLEKKTFNSRIRLNMLGNACAMDPSRFSYQPLALSNTNQNRIYAIAHF